MKTVYVVSLIYWDSGEIAGGGFNWSESKEVAKESFEQEVNSWGDSPTYVRLVELEVPDGTPDEITDWIDSNIEKIEYGVGKEDDKSTTVPALAVALCGAKS